MRALVILAGLATAAQANPTAATRAGIQSLGLRGTTDLIDPAKGLWFEGKHLCGGAEIVRASVKIADTLAWGGGDLTCKNGATASSCTIEDGAELRFDRTPNGLVLRSYGKAGKDTACPNATPIPVEPAPVITPLAKITPAVMTIETLGKLARKELPINAFADPRRGLTIVEEPPNATDTPDPGRHLRACGATLDKELAKIPTLLGQFLAGRKDDATSVSCFNAKGRSGCTLSQIGEWGDVWHLSFRQTEHGLVLDGLSLFDEHGVVASALREHDIIYDTAMANAWLTPCP
jgi:hypothetical protein